MKKILLLTLLACLSFHALRAQDSPQFSMNVENDYSSLIASGNDCDEYWKIWNALMSDIFISKKSRLDMCYRLYEIEMTSTVTYSSLKEGAVFQTAADTSEGLIPVSFGSTLEACTHPDMGYSQLWFSAPVTRIDPALFREEIHSILLPMTAGLQYEASPYSCVTHLSSLQGRDVIDRRALVDADGMLVVAAVAGLDSYEVPEQVRTVGAGAFRGCTLKTLVLPASVQRIDAAAFALCGNLASVSFLSPTPVSIDPSAFDPEGKTLIYVPKACYKEYRQANPQLKKRFKKISLRN